MWLKIRQGGRPSQKLCRGGGSPSLWISSLDYRRWHQPHVTWVHVTQAIACLRYTCAVCCLFKSHQWTVCFRGKRISAVVSFWVAKKNIGCTLGFPRSKLVHDLNLFWAYHNAVRLCWLSKATPNRLQNALLHKGMIRLQEKMHVDTEFYGRQVPSRIILRAQLQTASEKQVSKGAAHKLQIKGDFENIKIFYDKIWSYSGLKMEWVHL